MIDTCDALTIGGRALCDITLIAQGAGRAGGYLPLEPDAAHLFFQLVNAFTFGRLWLEPLLEACGHCRGAAGDADEGAEGSDHREDAGDVAVIEGTEGDTAADELSDDPGPEIGEGEDKVRCKREDLRDGGRGESRDPRLLAPDPAGRTA